MIVEATAKLKTREIALLDQIVKIETCKNFYFYSIYILICEIIKIPCPRNEIDNTNNTMQYSSKIILDFLVHFRQECAHVLHKIRWKLLYLLKWPLQTVMQVTLLFGYQVHTACDCETEENNFLFNIPIATQVSTSHVWARNSFLYPVL